MNFQRLVLLLFIFTLNLPAAFARKPAVEDFVGVEPKDYSRTPQGTEVPFDFGNIIHAQEYSDSTKNSNVTSTFVLISFILLPFAMWFGLTRKSARNSESNSTEQLAEVKNLADYQNNNKEEDIKKAS